MKVFAASDLQSKAAEIQKAALLQPVILTDREGPSYVMLSLEDYARLSGSNLVASPEAIRPRSPNAFRPSPTAIPEASRGDQE